ncbi:MFS transporter, partial|nr:MFS transporter [Escherichia coli]
PTIGPVVGGWITQTYAWHWLFLINVVPGIAAALCGVLQLPRDATALDRLRAIDLVALTLLASSLAALEIGLTQAPEHGWLSAPVVGLLAYSAASAAAFALRTLRSRIPVVDLQLLADRPFAMGCVLSFVLGIGLFGMVYL